MQVKEFNNFYWIDDLSYSSPLSEAPSYEIGERLDRLCNLLEIQDKNLYLYFGDQMKTSSAGRWDNSPFNVASVSDADQNAHKLAETIHTQTDKNNKSLVFIDILMGTSQTQKTFSDLFLKSLIGKNNDNIYVLLYSRRLETVIEHKLTSSNVKTFLMYWEHPVKTVRSITQRVGEW